ncbi:AcrB/AcrD/AcrF family protein [Corallococcus sp. H22C18031201]|uniref:efflux RND transporter permease subunit n=1 Tax=Citreicoccus inhibens TaxID=2849499 RepID=UPI000E7271FD|nr:CusA/CzcA family heavy metal efflux RND transporter [Citreicoccus inhibens]MBU8896270.1 CusA/CzcA family heavy metal efflux RND transporter [Citreicoccus inhibens]RJS17395.1 AcrB/AcrD/AcrF family protein [Corallococcus sp. H22C18031201]
MFEKLVEFSLKNRAAVVSLAVLAAIWGYFCFRDLTVEAFPDPTDTQVNIITLYPGQPSEEVERQIGLPLERALNGIPGLTRLRNLSMFGLSFVTLSFNDNTDVLFARAQVLERLRDAELPQGLTPSLGPLATPIGEIYRYTLKGAKGDPMKLRTLQDWVVRPGLLRVDGVADVVSYGGLLKEIHIQPDPARLAAYGLTLDNMEDALKEGSENASGGVLERGSEQFVIRSEGLFHTLDDVRDVRVATHEGTPVFLKDVADVSEGWSPRQGVVSRDGDADVVQGIVLMRRGENPSVVLSRVRDAVASVNLRLEGDDVRIDPFYDRTDLVNTTLRTVGHNLLEGALLVTLVLFIFLLDLRAAVVVSVLIPLSLLASFIYLKMRGMSANLLSMGAVDFGVIVDGGVVIIESILARMSGHQFEGETPMQRIERATKAVVRPTVFSLLIIIAAYLPIFMLQRVEGRIFAPMANTVVAALLGALVFSVTLIPVLASFVYRKPMQHKESPVLRAAAKAYGPVLTWSLKHPLTVVAMCTAGLLFAGALVPRMGSEFLPALNEGSLYLTFTMPSNISLSEGRKLVPRIEKLLRQAPQVDGVLSQLGRPEDGTDAKLTNNLEIFVKLKPPAQWPKNTPKLDDVLDVLQRSVSEVPGMEVGFSQPIGDNVNESISGQQGQLAVKLFGDDLQVLQAYSQKVKSVLSHVEGVADLGIVKSGEVPSIQVAPDRVALARYGMSLGDFQHVFQTAVGGRPLGEFWEGERRFDVVMRLPMSSRDDVEKISRLRVPVEGGVLVPLSELARVTTGFGRASINRENGRRYIGVRMNVRGRDLGSFVKDAQALVNKEAPAPAGTSIEWGGEFESKERAMDRLLTVLPVALVLTLLLLFKAFNSFGRAVVTLINVPFALMGGVFGLYWAGMPLSVAAAVGFIALIGQAALNGVLVMSAIAERREAGESLDDAILHGSRERLRPVLMTAALAALGLVPACLSNGIGSEMQKPLAVVIVSGTISACALTLVLLPVLFRLFARFTEQLADRMPQKLLRAVPGAENLRKTG